MSLIEPDFIQDPFLHFSDLGKSFPARQGSQVVVKGFELRVAKGEFISVIGHSGCGKSTVLMITAGLNNLTTGGIFLENKMITGPAPDRGVVFQSPSLFPWMTALENVMLGVRQVFPHATKLQRRDICRHYLNKVGLAGALDRRAGDMSAGMKQRVAIARAFALKPKLLLLDEPFGMLDALTRAELQEVLLEVWSSERITAIMITHDVDEAIFLSDRVVMMTSGPAARVGDILPVRFPRPRLREDVIEHPDYYGYRGHLIDFLEGHQTARPEKEAARVVTRPVTVTTT